MLRRMGRDTLVLASLVLLGCAEPPPIEQPEAPPIQVGLGPDVYPLAYVPMGPNGQALDVPDLLGREVVVQARGVAVILGGASTFGRDPGREYRTTRVEEFPTSFVFGRNVAYITEATRASEPLRSIQGDDAAPLANVRVALSGAITEVELARETGTGDPGRPVVRAVYFADTVDYMTDHEGAWGQSMFAVRIGGIAGPPGRLRVGARGADEWVDLEATVPPSVRVVVWQVEPEPSLLWVSSRNEGVQPELFIDTRPNDAECGVCLAPGEFTVRRRVPLPKAATLEVTYLAWSAPDVPAGLSRQDWSAYRASVGEALARTERVEG